MDYSARPVPEFNKYEAIDLLETLQNTARDNQDEKKEYYRLVYQTARGKIDLPKEHFRSLVMRLLGSKDHTTVYEAVAKVEKAAGGRNAPWGPAAAWGHRSSYWQRNQWEPYNSYRGRGWRGPSQQCYACGRYGHVADCCFRRGSGLRPRQPSTRGRGSERGGSSGNTN